MALSILINGSKGRMGHALADAAKETTTHKAALDAFRAQVAIRQPTLKVETGLMAINGRFETLA